LSGTSPAQMLSAMARRPTYRKVWCPHCHHERETGALPRTKLRCPSCGGAYRAPDLPDAEDLPMAAVAGEGSPPVEQPPASPAPAAKSGPRGVIPKSEAASWGRRGGRAAAKLGRKAS
jgi:ribosomal protein S27E